MNLYAESSAVLASLLTENTAVLVRNVLEQADFVVASDLTLVECDRILIRATISGRISEAAATERRAQLNTAATQWELLHVSPEIVRRARQPFPSEPIRTLDAIHLATALAARSALSGLQFLSLDDRTRRAAQQLGFQLQP